MASIQFLSAERGESIAVVRRLFTEYASSLDFDLCFQDFDKELSGLPGPYARPDGRLIVAMDGGKAAGCVALRKLEEGVCEMKRLYVKPDHRGKGIGRKLVNAILDEAKKIGYAKMRLDTISSMSEAIELYESVGFHEIEAYRPNPIEGAVFFELDLKSPRGDDEEAGS